MKVLIADDHAIVREGLRALIEKQSDWEVVGEAKDGQKAVQLAGELLPDIVIMDVVMPNLNGIEATRQIVDKLPSIRVVALSMHSSRHFVVDMLKAIIAPCVKLYPQLQRPIKECPPLFLQGYPLRFPADLNN